MWTLTRHKHHLRSAESAIRSKILRDTRGSSPVHVALRGAVAETYGQVRAAAEPIHLQILDAVGVDRVKERTIHDLPRDRVGVCKCSAD